MIYGRNLALIHDEGFKAFSDHAYQEIHFITILR